MNFLKITRSEAIDSSMLSNLKYNKLTKKLTATFTSGAVYDYFKVSRKDAKLLFNVFLAVPRGTETNKQTNKSSDRRSARGRADGERLVTASSGPRTEVKLIGGQKP